MHVYSPGSKDIHPGHDFVCIAKSLIFLHHTRKEVIPTLHFIQGKSKCFCIRVYIGISLQARIEKKLDVELPQE